MKYNNQKTTEERQQEVKEAFDSINEGVVRVFTSDKYKEYLSAMKHFNNYSFNNMILIMMQKPDASMVCSFSKWKTLGRYVKKGEKGIHVLAPCPHHYKKQITTTDENGEETKETKEIKYLSYTIKSCFDISQTEGDPIPQICSELQGESERAEAIISAIKEVCEWPIVYKPQVEMHGAMGSCSHLEQQINIRDNIGSIQEAKTLIHEYTHKLLHDPEISKNKSRDQKEIEAESVAFAVSDYFGIDTSEYSFEYVASWGHGREQEELKNILKHIQDKTVEIIEELEPVFMKEMN